MKDLNCLLNNAVVYGKNGECYPVLADIFCTYKTNPYLIENIFRYFNSCNRNPSGVDRIDISKTKLQRILNERAR